MIQMIPSLLLLIAPALADRLDTAMPCLGPYPTALVPIEASTGIPVATVPAVLVNADCSSGTIDVTLTGESGEVQTTTVDVARTDVHWLTELVLAPDTSYVLEATGSDGNAIHSSFSTGAGEPTPLAGKPSVEITGSELGTEGPYATVSLKVSPIADPAGAVWSLARDGDQIAVGVDGPVSLIDSFEGHDGQVCYRADQYHGSPETVAVSVDTCVVLSLPATVTVEKSSCSVLPGEASGALAPLIGAMLVLLGVRRAGRTPQLGGRA